MKAKLRQWIAMLMTLIMVFSSAPVGVLADEAAPAGTVVETRTEDGALNGEDATVVTGMKTETRGLSLRRVAAYKNTWHVVFTDGGATVAEQYLLPGETMIVPQVQETANHKFTGWVKQSGYGADAAPVGQAFTDALAQDETTVYAAAYQDVYYLFFHDVDEQDGRVLRTKEWVVGETTDALTTSDVRPSLSGNQEFEGWLEGGAPAQATYENLTGDVHLYPDVATGHWITFDVDGGAAIEPEFVVGNTVRPADPVRSGYRFDGWFDASGAAFTFGGTLTENITLTARWTAQSVNYTVVYLYENANDKNYSYVGSYTGTALTGSTVSINKTTADRYSYKGKDLTNFTFSYVEPATATIAGNGSTIISVYYTRNVYTVRFYDRRGRTEDTSLRIEAKYGAYIGDKWPGGGWYVNTSGNTAQSNLLTMPSQGKNFYGQQTSGWEQTATYYKENLQGDTSGTPVGGKYYTQSHQDTARSSGTLTVTDEERYNITGFKVNTTISAENGDRFNGAEFYYDRLSFTLTFMNGGTALKTESVQFEAPLSTYAGEAPTQPPAGLEGYIFKGWYDNEKGAGTAYDLSSRTMPATNVILYACWVAPTVSGVYYTVMVGGASNDLQVKYGETIDQTKLPTPTAPEGYEFVYWAREVDGQLHPFNFATVIKENIVLRPYFIPKGSVQVTYHKNGGEGNVPEDTQHYVVKESYADVRAGATLTKNGKAFSHWTLNADGTGDKYYPGDKLLVTGAVTLYAQYTTESDRFTLSFVLAGGNVDGAATLPSETLYRNQKHALPTPTRAGYTFEGWQDRAGNMWNGGSNISLTSHDTVTAQWTARTDMPYTVEFYYQNDDQQGYTKDASLTAIRNDGETDQTVSVTDEDKGQTRNGQYKLNEGASTLTTTVAADGSTVLKLYFDLNQFTVTIHYVYADGQAPADNPLGGNKAADDFSDVLTVGVWYRVDSPAINGYTASESAVSGTMGAGNVEHTVVYTKRNDLTYTINYYWVGTEDKVAESTTVTGCTFNDVVSLAPLAVPNYTPVSNETVHLTIGTGENVVNFYYYKNIALQGNSLTVTYDGAEHSVSGFTGQILPDGTAAPASLLAATGFNVGAKGTDAGTYPARFPANANGTVVSGQYYVSIVLDGSLVINPVTDKVTVTIKGHTATRTYDGTKHTVTGYDWSADNDLYTSDCFRFNGKAAAEGMDANTYPMGIQESDFENISKNFKNVEFKLVEDGQLVVKPRAVILTSASGKKVYDGTALTSKWLLDNGMITEEVTVSGDGFAAGEGATFGVIGSRVNVGKSDNEFAYRLNRNTDVNNYTIEVVKGELEVTPVTDQVTVTITGHADSKVYNGQTQQVEGYDVAISNPLYTENDFTYEGSQTASGVNADAYPMGMDKKGFANISQNFTNVIFDVTDGGLTITKRPVTITVANDEKEYGNPDPTFASAVMTGQVLGELGGIDHTVTRTNTAEQVGNYPGVLRISATKEDLETEYTNYTFTVGSGDFTIKARTEKYVITVEANSGAFLYDGTEHTVSGFKTLTFVVDGRTYKVSGLIASVTERDADRYTVQVLGTAKVTDEQENDVTGQFTVNRENGEMVITPRRVILTSASGKKVYDGTALTSKWLLDNGKIEEEVTVSGNGFAAGEGATYTVSGSRVNVGTADNTFTYRLNAGVKASNYTIETSLGELEVTPVTDQVTVTITEHSATVEYDDAAHTVTGYDVTSISNGLYKHGDFSFSGNDSVTGTDVGRYEMKVKPSDFTNNNQNFTNVVFVIVDGALVITPRGADPRNPVIIRANDLVVGYDGLEHGENGYTATRLAEGHSVRSVIIDGKRTLIGVYPEEFKPHDAIIVDKEGKDVTGNYKVTYKNGDLTITGDEIKPEKTTPQVNSNYALGGDPIPFTITVQSVAKDAVKNVIVRDDNAVLAEGSGYRLQDAHTAIIDVLESGATVIVQAYHEVTSDDILAGTVGNTATVSWENTTRTVEAGTSQLEGVDVTLDVVKTSDLKTPDGAKKAALGTSIRYTITVTNNGNVPYYNVRVDDDMTGLHEVIDTLPVGKTRTFHTAYTVTEQDLLNGQVENLVTAEGRKVEDPKDGTLKTPKGEDTEIDQTESVQATLSIAKTSNKKAGETAALNERITYTLTVKNTGNVTLYNVHVDDDLTGLHETVSILKKGGEKTFTTFYTVTEQDILNGRVFNVATAKADPVIDPADPEHPAVPSDRAEKEDETDDVCTDLSVRKLSDRKPEDKAKLGEVINYTITVKNTGNVTYYNVHVDDDLTGMHEIIAVLGVGEEKTFTTSCTVTEQDILNGRVLNVATAKGNPIVDPKDPKDPKIPEDEGKKEDDTEDVRVTMTLEKTVVNLPARGYFVAGEEAQFHLTVKNTGNQTLRNVRVTEMLTGASVKNGTGYTVVNGAAVADEMKPGDTVTVNAVYTVRAEDIGETVENVAVARGEGPVDPKDETRRIDPEEQWARAQVPVDEAFRAKGHVIWQDKSNAFDTRPGSVQVTLLADGVPVDEQTVIGEGDSWLFIFDKQPAHRKDGTPIVYTVKQDDHTGYTVTYPADTLDIVNDLEKYTLTIRYWMFKVGGEAAFHPVVRDYYYGESYSVVSPKKEGFWPSISRVEGVMREDVAYNVVYDWVNYNLIIHYVYLDGAQAAPAYTATLHMGDEYQVLSPYIEGYTPTIREPKGVMPARDVTYTVIYLADEEPIVVPDAPSGMGPAFNAGECFE